MRRTITLSLLLLAACNGGSNLVDGGTPQEAGPTGDLGASTGPLTCQGYTMPAFSKACSAKSDCVVVTHTIDCCGTGKAIGLNAADQAAFVAEEKKCAATYPGCGCPTGPTHTEDGSQAPWGASAIDVDCVAGVCLTYVAACGKPCPGELVCKTCTVQTTTYGACSHDCTADTDCADLTDLPACEDDGFGGKFCTAGSVGCGTP